MDVPAHSPEVALVLDQLALEPSLKEVSWPPMAFGVPVGVAGYEVLHAPRKIGTRGAQEQVQVIRHEHEAEKLPAKTIDSLFQAVNHSLIVTIVPEDDLPRVPSGHHVVDRAGKFGSQRSCHGVTLPSATSPVNRLPDLTPRSRSPRSRSDLTPRSR